MNAVQPYTPNSLFNQANRTAPTRQYFYSLADSQEICLSLDIGCGTGVITPELTSFASFAHTIGLDIDPHLLVKAKDNNPDNVKLHWLLSDARALPFRSSTHSFVISHFTLMWIPEVHRVLTELHRVLKSPALFTAIEPDYSGRIEGSTNPPRNEHYPIVDWLFAKGANPFLGGQLPSKLHDAGFSEILYGILSWEYHATAAKEEIQDEAALLQADGIQWEEPLFTYTPIFWITGRKA